MKALVGAFNQEKALVGAFSVIVQPVVEPIDRFTALVYIQLYTTPQVLTHSIHYGGCGGAACLDKNKWETSQVWAKCP